jgi:DNA-directed RNA polymerase subunit omega
MSVGEGQSFPHRNPFESRAIRRSFAATNEGYSGHSVAHVAPQPIGEPHHRGGIDMSMIRPPLETLLDKVDNKYALVIGVAKRARQLKEGQLPMVDIPSTNPVTVALEEIAAGKVRAEKPSENIKED